MKSYYSKENKDRISKEFHKFQTDKSKIARISVLLPQIAPSDNPQAEIFKFA